MMWLGLLSCFGVIASVASAPLLRPYVDIGPFLNLSNAEKFLIGGLVTFLIGGYLGPRTVNAS